MKFEGSIKEVLEFIEKEKPEFAGALRKSMIGAIISLVGSEEMQEAMRGIVESEVKHAVTAAVREALIITQTRRVGGGYVKELEGYMAEEFTAAMGDIFKQSEGVEGILRKVADEKLKYLVERYETRADKTVDEYVKRLIPHYVTNAYKERVAEQFEIGGIQPMLEEMLQKTIGKMIMSGALSINAGGAKDE